MLRLTQYRHVACVLYGVLMSFLPTWAWANFEKNLERIFEDKVADVRVIFGYDDYNKGVWATKDEFRAFRLMKYLESKGFKPLRIDLKTALDLGVPQDAPNVRLYGGKSLQNDEIRVAMIWSSCSMEPTAHLNEKYDEQQQRSQEAQNFFVSAIERGEVVLYVGHSRGGGGPDTLPPVTKGVDKAGIPKVNYAFYRNKKPGLSALEASFRKNPSTPYILALTSCKSDAHFATWLNQALELKVNPVTVLLATRLTRYMPNDASIKSQDEGLMACVSILHALQLRQSETKLRENLRNSEMPDPKNGDKPVWKLRTMPF